MFRRRLSIVDLTLRAGSNIYTLTLPGPDPPQVLVDSPFFMFGEEKVCLNFAGRLRTCDYCYTTLHTPEECQHRPKDANKRCRVCNADDHLAASCTKPRPPKRCFGCRSLEHEVCWCPRSNCSACGAKGHMSKVCNKSFPSAC